MFRKSAFIDARSVSYGLKQLCMEASPEEFELDCLIACFRPMIFVCASAPHKIKLAYAIGVHTVLYGKCDRYAPKVVLVISAFEAPLKIMRHSPVYKRLQYRDTLSVQEERPQPGPVTAERFTHRLFHECFKVGQGK